MEKANSESRRALQLGSDGIRYSGSTLLPMENRWANRQSLVDSHRLKFGEGGRGARVGQGG